MERTERILIIIAIVLFVIALVSGGAYLYQRMQRPAPLQVSEDTLDSDADGLTDAEEANTYHTNPNIGDSDGDGISDRDEVKQYKTDPTKADTDGDGYSDSTELRSGHDPLKK